MWWKMESPRASCKMPGQFDHVTNLHTLPSLEEVDDYGSYCFFDWNYPVLYYDDDEPACICGREDCDGMPGVADPEALEVNPYEHYWCECGTMDCQKADKKPSRKHKPHRPTTLAVCYPSNHDNLRAEYTTIIHEELVVFPDSFAPPSIAYPPKMDGWVYAVATQPDLSLHRIKFGFSTNVESRLKSYKTPCPRSLLLGAWEADEHEEGAIFEFLSQHGFRFGGSEEFDLRHPFEALAEIPAFLSEIRNNRRYEMSRDATGFTQ